MKRKRWWTVILLYPDYLTSDYGADLYVDWAFTPDPHEAVSIVQGKALEAQRDNTKKGSCDSVAALDFRMIAVLRGRHRLELCALDA